MFTMLLALATVPSRADQKVGNGSNTTQSSNADKRGTDESPLVVNAHSIRSAEEAAEEAARDAEQERTNQLNIKLTFAIAICAGLQFLGILGQIGVYIRQTNLLNKTLGEVHAQAEQMKRQADLMEQQAADARKSGAQTFSVLKEQTDNLLISAKANTVTAMAADESAKAAQRSAELAVGISIPTLVVHEFGTGNFGAASAEAFFQYPKIKITVKNYRQTPALLQWWTLCFTCQELPDIPIYEGPASGIPLEKMAVQAGDTFTLPGFPSWHRQEFSLERSKGNYDERRHFHRLWLHLLWGYLRESCSASQVLRDGTQHFRRERANMRLVVGILSRRVCRNR